MSGYFGEHNHNVSNPTVEAEKVVSSLKTRGATASASPYASLQEVLDQALVQASEGKGKERHANEGEPFEEQVICEVRRRLGSGYTLGQAVKKIYESQRLDGEAGVRELLGAIVYIAAEVIVAREEINGDS